jgi:hypothetical protein
LVLHIPCIFWKSKHMRWPIVAHRHAIIPSLAGTGFMILLPLLNTQGPPPWHPAPEDVKAACKRAAEYAQAQGSNISRLAIKWALQQSSISSHLIGFSKPQQAGHLTLVFPMAQALQVIALSCSRHVPSC